MNVRAAAAQVIAGVLRGKSLSSALPPALESVAANEHALLQEFVYGTLRWYPALERLLNLLLHKPIRDKDLEIQALLALGLYQLRAMEIAPHAVINETVNAAQFLHREWAKNLVNAILRNYQRSFNKLQERLAGDEIFATAHPQRLVDAIRQAWPKQFDAIIAANNSRPTMTLRVNSRVIDRETYQRQLATAGLAAIPTAISKQGLQLKAPAGVHALPGFDAGMVSVQDESAQLAAVLLDAKPGQRVLDACCAPGGKTCHILEREPGVGELVAIDRDKERIQRVEENLRRLGLQANLLVADSSKPEDWWDQIPFQRILLDAPCSATGVIRHHPDIKLLRRQSDIAKLAATQLHLLENVWKVLEPGGLLVYATCSVLDQENDNVIEGFLRFSADAQCSPIFGDWGIDTRFGKQLLPTIDAHDGFYYARLLKAG